MPLRLVGALAVALMAEERVGLAVKQPTALTYGDFGNVT